MEKKRFRIKLPRFFWKLRGTGPRKGARLLRGAFMLCAAFGVVLVAALGTMLIVLSGDIPTIGQIAERRVNQSTKIYDREGKTLLYEASGGERRTVIPFEKIPQALRDATVAIEDERFYESPGFDWRGILRAFLVNIRRGEIRQGGSSITQQLARNAFLTPEQTLARKIKEFILAVRLNKQYTKDEVLALYLNEIPYGSTLYGVEAASQAYFGKPARELTVAESALLAAMPKAPSYYSPWGSHTKELFARQRSILIKMRDLGKLDAAQVELALGEEIKIQPKRDSLIAPHFVMAVQEYLVQKYGEEAIRTGGLTVQTTLDAKFQEIAERVVREGAERNEKLYKGENAALVAQNPKTGEILALVGSRDYFDIEREGNFDVATQGKRQPGSALKPFVYLAAFMKGYTPETVLFDVPTEFVPRNPPCPPDPDYSKEETRCFHPQNFDGKFRGPITLRSALAQSVNIPAVKLLYLVGLKDALSLLQEFGVTTLNNPSRYGLSLVLGGGEVRLVDLVQAYSVLAQDGVWRPQRFVREVRDSAGNVLESYREESREVAPENAVRALNGILSDEDARAPLFGGSQSLTSIPGREVALKTGTSNDYKDAWAMGYTPSLVVGVWAGNNNNRPMQKQGSSILAAVPIWSAFIKEALLSSPVEQFTRPDPASPAKPILRGDFLSGGEPHTILFSVNKGDPTGPEPVNPASDPQFEYWEHGVTNWAQQHPGELTASGTVQGPRTQKVVVASPAAGSYVENSIPVHARTFSLIPLTEISIYFNGVLTQKLTGPFPGDHSFNTVIAPKEFSLQNSLEVEILDERGDRDRAAIIVYR